MRNVFLVIKREIRETIGKPSFWLTAFVFPLIIFAITFGSQMLAQGLTDDETDADPLSALTGQATEAAARPAGYVDRAGVVREMPEAIPEGMFLSFPAVEDAEAALESGEIDRYYLVPADVYETGQIVIVQAQFSPFPQLEGQDPFRYVLLHNLTGDPDVAALLLDALPRVRTESIVTEAGAGESESGEGVAAMVAPTAMLFIFFFVLTMSSSFMLRSVTKEKESRVVELLLLSLRPRELMLGKILGLGVAALVQMAIWLGGGMLVLGEGLPILGLAASAMSLDLPTGFLVWVALYFLLGYLTFSSALGALGTLAPNMREGSQFTFVLLLPLMIPLWLSSTFIEAPNGPLATILSLFPLTSPVSMVTRLAATTVPLWQILLSLGLLAATTYGFVLVSARFFRADTLLSTAPLNLQRILNELRGRVT